jgi:hypothetical protein
MSTKLAKLLNTNDDTVFTCQEVIDYMDVFFRTHKPDISIQKKIKNIILILNKMNDNNKIICLFSAGGGTKSDLDLENENRDEDEDKDKIDMYDDLKNTLEKKSSLTNIIFKLKMFYTQILGLDEKETIDKIICTTNTLFDNNLICSI